jgi:hypothetical protein
MEISETKRDWKMTKMSIEQGLQTGDIELLLGDRNNNDLQYITAIANVKRFLERWSADRQFREALPSDPYGVTREYKLDIDPEEIYGMWDFATLMS